MTMWWKIALGAVAGFAVGSFVAPGYALWVAVGALAGFGADMWARRRAQGGDGGSG